MVKCSDSHRCAVLFSRAVRGLPFVLFAMLSACSHAPYANIMSINQSQTLLYITAKSDDKDGGYVKTFDPNTYAVKDKVTIADAGSPDIVGVLQDQDGLVMVVRDGRSRASLYRLEEGKLPYKLGMISPYASLFSGADRDFFYAISSADKKAQGIYISGMRYDKTLNGQRPNHFSENPNLVVIGVSEDNDAYWYVCLERSVVPVFSSISGLSGRMVLARRSKDKKEYRQFEYGADELHSVYSTADDGHVWIFASSDVKDVKGSRAEPKIIKFTKTEQKFATDILPMSVVPFPHQRLARESDYLWTIANDNRIIRISKKDYSYAATALPRHLRIYSGMQRTRALFSTDDFLLVGAYDFENKIYKGVEEFPSPFLLKFSKSDMHVEQIPVKPTTWEAVRAGASSPFIGVYRGCCLTPAREYEKHDY
jgi:hypothetical protein